MKKIKYKKGDYIVLLAGFDGEDSWPTSIPINHCYKLSKDSSFLGFWLEKDLNGSRSNGWFVTDNKDCGVRFRHATNEEIIEYELENKPYCIHNIKTIIENKEEYNNSLIKLLQNIG